MSPVLFLAPFIKMNMKTIILLFALAFCLQIRGQEAGHFLYKEPSPIVDTLTANADYFLHGEFHGFKPVKMVCSGKIIPVLKGNVWGSTRFYESVVYLNSDLELIEESNMVALYDIPDPFLGWRPDD